MKQGFFEIVSNERLTDNVMELVLRGDTSEIAVPGQFVNIKLDGFFLRRPLSVCNCEQGANADANCGAMAGKNEGMLTLIYKIVGEGTRALAEYKAGEMLDILTGLGNGYDISKSGDEPLLIGGGAGVPPMFLICRKLIAAGTKPTVILGFNSKAEVFYENEFKSLGARVIVTTADGSYGVRGFVTDAMKDISYSYTYACGPEPMLRAVYEKAACGGQYSFEERMGCGFGACMGCSCKTKYGSKRICKDGPVLLKEEIIW